ncbi:hypothetical protein [Acinetobacter ursingii]|uniref:hypothetical protein n=1 Tax=Acinetobacter ursingii TaxID=108980 RepID=UPI0030089E67
MAEQGTNTQSRIDAARKAGLSDSEILQGMKESNRYAESFKKAYAAGLTDDDIASDFGLKIQPKGDPNDQKLWIEDGNVNVVNPPIRLTASGEEYVPPDIEQIKKEEMLNQAKEAGPVQPWESTLLGFSNLGSGLVQGTSYAADAISSGLNSVLGTDLDTGSYDRVTQDRQDVNDWYNLRREANNQGIDAYRFAGELGATAPLSAGSIGSTLLSTLGRSALSGAGLSAASFANDSEQRADNTAFGAIGGAIGGTLGKVLASGIVKGINVLNNNIQKPAQEIMNIGDDFGVRTSLGDITQNPLVQRAEVAMEQVPVVGTSGFRKSQQDEVKQAAKNLLVKFKQNLTSTEFKSLNNIQNAAALGDKNAQRIVGIINNADDTGKVLQAAAEVKNWRASNIASQMYNKVESLAGNTRVPTSNTVQAIDNVIASDSKVVPNDKLLNELNSIRDKLSDPTINVNFSELRSARSRLGELVNQWGREGENTAGLTAIRNSIDQDMSDFAMSSGRPELISAFKKANGFYKNWQIGRDKALAKAISSQTPDQIFTAFIKVGQGDKAKNFYRNLDPKGQAALRFEMINRAIDKASNESKDVFSPAKFALEFERLRKPYENIFSGTDKAQMDSFVKLMRHVERAGQYAENPPTGNRIAPILMGGAAVANAPLAIKAAIATGIANALFTTKVGQRLLLSSKELPVGSEKLTNLLKLAEKMSMQSGRSVSTEEQNNQSN